MKRLSLSCFIIVFCSLALSVQAQDNILLKDALSEADKTAKTILAEASRTGNSLLITAANEISMLIELVRSNYSEMLDETIDKVDPKLKAVLQTINNAVDTAGKLPQRAECLADDVFVDVRSLLRAYPKTGQLRQTMIAHAK